MPSRDKKDLDSRLVSAYDKACIKFKELYPEDAQPFLTCTYRSPEEQNELYKIGRSLPGRKVTNLQGPNSAHNQNPSKAFDIAFVGLNKKLDWTPALFKKFSELIDKEIVECGSDWKKFVDLPHYQLKGWKIQ